MPRPRLTPGERPARLRIKVPQALLAQITAAMEQIDCTNKSEFIRVKLAEVLSDDLTIIKEACHDLIWLFDKFTDNPTAKGFLQLLDQLDLKKIDKAKELIKHE